MDPDLLRYQPPQKKEGLIDFFQTLVVFGAILSMVYWQIAQPHKVQGSSMTPTFKNGDFIITDKVSYRFKTPNRGDVVVFRSPKNKAEEFIKRVIGTPGDRIKIQEGRILLNGQLLDEPYLAFNTFTKQGNFTTELTVGPESYFVLGDNRDNSSDSREWGTITKDKVVGRVLLRYWPPQSVGVNPGAYSIQ